MSFARRRCAKATRTWVKNGGVLVVFLHDRKKSPVPSKGGYNSSYNLLPGIIHIQKNYIYIYLVI